MLLFIGVGLELQARCLKLAKRGNRRGSELVVAVKESPGVRVSKAQCSQARLVMHAKQEIPFGEGPGAASLVARAQKALKLKVNTEIGKAYGPEEKGLLFTEAKKRRSKAIYPALVLSLHCGVRDKELRGLQWSRVHLREAYIAVGESKTEAGTGRTVPLNALALEVLKTYSAWYLEKFKELKPEWYVFPAGRPQPTDPTRPCTSFKTVWQKIKANAGVTGRWHDNRHTFITGLAESGEASDQTIMDMAGHVSRRMLKHYSHIRMEAKRRAVAALIPADTGSTPEEKKTVAAAQTEPNSESMGKEMGKVRNLSRRAAS